MHLSGVAQFIDIEGNMKNGRTHLPVINFKERPDFVGKNVMQDFCCSFLQTSLAILKFSGGKTNDQSLYLVL